MRQGITFHPSHGWFRALAFGGVAHGRHWHLSQRNFAQPTVTTRKTLDTFPVAQFVNIQSHKWMFIHQQRQGEASQVSKNMTSEGYFFNAILAVGTSPRPQHKKTPTSNAIQERGRAMRTKRNNSPRRAISKFWWRRASMVGYLKAENGKKA